MNGEYEGRENLTNETKDLERARQSLIEELEAINWYQERVETCKNKEPQHLGVTPVKEIALYLKYY